MKEFHAVYGDLLYFSKSAIESIDETNIYFCWKCNYNNNYNKYLKNSIFIFKEEYVKDGFKYINTFCYSCKEEVDFTYHASIKNPYAKVKYILI